MVKSEATILLVSDDADLHTRTRKQLETCREGVRVTVVSNLDAAWRVVEDASPDVILLEDVSLGIQVEGRRGCVPDLTNAVCSLASYAPVVVIGAPEYRGELSALVSAGAADYVERKEGCLPLALEHVQRRLQHNSAITANVQRILPSGDGDFGEVLRHELNNPLTGILGNAELLLVEIRRKNDGRLPNGGQQRVETIAALAVRLRETVRRLSQEWEARHADAR